VLPHLTSKLPPNFLLYSRQYFSPSFG
jgi:hypothetical protein